MLYSMLYKVRTSALAELGVVERSLAASSVHVGDHVPDRRLVRTSAALDTAPKARFSAIGQPGHAYVGSALCTGSGVKVVAPGKRYPSMGADRIAKQGIVVCSQRSSPNSVRSGSPNQCQPVTTSWVSDWNLNAPLPCQRFSAKPLPRMNTASNDGTTSRSLERSLLRQHFY